jgi:DNA invertase Pin-like site-specific DNA recombinase
MSEGFLPKSAEGLRPTHSELVKRGIARAKAMGHVFGRPRSIKEPEVRKLLEAGWSQSRVRKELRVGFECVKRIYDQIKAGK